MTIYQNMELSTLYITPLSLLNQIDLISLKRDFIFKSKFLSLICNFIWKQGRIYHFILLVSRLVILIIKQPSASMKPVIQLGSNLHFILFKLFIIYYYSYIYYNVILDLNQGSR